MRKEDNIEKSVRQIEIFDTLVAFLAGLIIVPAVFVFSGGDRSALNAGPKLMFVTLPNVFDSMSGGQIVGTVFFVLVALAALTSSISLMETVVSIMCERFKLKRVTSCLIVIAFSFLLGMVSIFGYSIWSDSVSYTHLEIDAEMREIIEGGYQKSKDILEEHMDQLHLLAKYLMKFEKIDSNDFEILMKGEMDSKVFENSPEDTKTEENSEPESTNAVSYTHLFRRQC